MNVSYVGKVTEYLAISMYNIREDDISAILSSKLSMPFIFYRTIKLL